MSFPEDFIFSTATSSYQIEGAWNEDGKGENMWDRIIHSKPENCDNAEVACDSYHLYEEDVKMIKKIGFNMYRFSISWTRILPNGEITEVNELGVNYYNKLIDELLKNDIEPMVTIYHWDLPQRIQDIGGWTNPLIVDYIEDYADLLFQLFGDRVKWWITINEPMEMVRGYELKAHAPALNLDSPANYLVIHNILRAHARIYRLYQEKYKHEQHGKISITIDCRCLLPKTDSPDDIEAANRAREFHIGMIANPIYGKNGDYPELVRKIVDQNSKTEGRKRSRLPYFTKEERKAIRGSTDFFAMNHYTTILCTPGFNPDDPTSRRDMNVKYSSDPNWSVSATPWLKVVPSGFKEVLKYIKDKYDNPSIFVTENGYCDRGELEDVDRICYHRDYLTEMSNAMKEYDCKVIGYTVWSLLDNFEWFSGYQFKFGIVQVDFKSEERKRTPKESAIFFQELIRTHKVPDNEE